MKRISVYLAEQQIDRLNQLADDTDVTVSRHIRKAIDEYLSVRTPIITGSKPFVPFSDVAIGVTHHYENDNVKISLSSLPRITTNNIGFGNESGEEWHL